MFILVGGRRRVELLSLVFVPRFLLALISLTILVSPLFLDFQQLGDCLFTLGLADVDGWVFMDSETSDHFLHLPGLLKLDVPSARILDLLVDL